MQSRMQRDEPANNIEERNTTNTPKGKGTVGDYIDFEEVK